MTLHRFLGLAGLSLVLAACEGSDSPTQPLAPVATSVTLWTTTVTFSSLGATQQLAATVKDQYGQALSGATITWTSSNVQVASVSSSGVVTSVGNGTATITATSGSASVTVSASVQQVAASITLSATTVTFSSLGATQQLSATGKDQNGQTMSGLTVTWASSAAQVASVSSSGLVTSVGNGTAIITATSGAASGVAIVTVTYAIGVGLGAGQFVLIQPGTFQMGDRSGSNDKPDGSNDEKPVHTVNITKAFYLQKTEVTQGQWRAVMDGSPSFFRFCGSLCPVEMVNWDEIQGFLAKLNQANPGANYRLPTEAEWEYAARAGTTGEYGGNSVLNDMGWYEDNSGSTPHPVAQKQADAWGLYDMHGNVCEWVQDWYSATYYGVSPTNDPTGPATGSARVFRGGPWNGSAVFARSASRSGQIPSYRYDSVGFRLARTP